MAGLSPIKNVPPSSQRGEEFIFSPPCGGSLGEGEGYKKSPLPNKRQKKDKKIAMFPLSTLITSPRLLYN
jgi:hypothetical protein